MLGKTEIQSLEGCLVEHCAPTLASMKTAGLFRVSFCSREQMKREVLRMREMLAVKNVSVTVLKLERNSALVYVYREKKLLSDIEKGDVKSFLEGYGYSATSAEEAVSRLRERLSESGEFPHEIGLFLGYPLEDVTGFMVHKGRDYRCCGWWKVYGDETEARKLFAKYDKCRRIYMQLFRQGRSILQLTVAA